MQFLFLFKKLKLFLVRIFIIFVHIVNFKRKRVFISGIQRSGTNILSYILTLNHIHVINKDYFRKKYKVRNKPGYVHYYHRNTLLTKRYNGKKINFKTIENYNRYLGEKNTKHIIIKRNIKDWLKSIKKYAKYNKDWKLVNSNKFYISEYNKFYNFYEKNKNDKNILFVNVENISRSKKDLFKIEKFLNVKLLFKGTKLYVSLKL